MDASSGVSQGIINHRANETWNQNNVRFGFVDFINDNEVVDALFKAVADWGKARGKDMLQGPMGFSDLDHEGMLIEGFDQLGTMATIYNYAYYPKHMQRMGFVKDQDWQEYKIMIPRGDPREAQAYRRDRPQEVRAQDAEVQESAGDPPLCTPHL